MAALRFSAMSAPGDPLWAVTSSCRSRSKRSKTTTRATQFFRAGIYAHRRRRGTDAQQRGQHHRRHLFFSTIASILNERRAQERPNLLEDGLRDWLDWYKKEGAGYAGPFLSCYGEPRSSWVKLVGASRDARSIPRINIRLRPRSLRRRRSSWGEGQTVSARIEAA
jgi:hypothetical protein